MTDLTLEYNDRNLETGVIMGGAVAITPPIDDNFWHFRVRLSEEQAIVGFPKFFTIGIGFSKEEDWNTNLPYLCRAEEIFDHISHNKGNDRISDEDCIAAIKLVQEAARVFQGLSKEEYASEQARVSR